MLYTLTLNEQHFIMSLSHTDHDDVELNTDEMQMDYLNAYMYENGQLSFSNAEKDRIIAQRQEIAKQERITELKSYLNSTDYIYAKCTEVGEDVNVVYAEVVAKRKEARKEIQDLEA